MLEANSEEAKKEREAKGSENSKEKEEEEKALTQELIPYQCLRDPIQVVIGNEMTLLDLDDRDVKHILAALLANHWNNKSPSDRLHPLVLELARIYQIQNVDDFIRKIGFYFRRDIIALMNRARDPTDPLPPQILTNYQPQPKIIQKIFGNKFDEFGHKRDAPSRPMTSNELDDTIKNVMNLELELDKQERKEGQQRGKKEGEEERKEDEFSFDEGQSHDELLAYDSMMTKIQDRWKTKRLADSTYVGGDWRVRLGIAEPPPPKFDIPTEVDRQMDTQLQEDFLFTSRKRFAVSPYTIPGLPFDESKHLELDFRNVKYLNQFVNSRGMLLPRFMTGLDKKSQRRMAEAVKRARHMGLMPYTNKLLILDKDKIKRAKEDHDVQTFLYQEKDQYDPLTIEDLRKMYPEYAPDDEEYHQLLEKQQSNTTDTSKGSVDLKALYDVKQEEIDHYEKIKHEFLKNIKKDIIESIPDYWKKRRQLREQATKAGWIIARDKTKPKQRERIG